MPRSKQESAVEEVSLPRENTTIPAPPQPAFAPDDTPDAHQSLPRSRESVSRPKVVVITGAAAGWFEGHRENAAWR